MISCVPSSLVDSARCFSCLDSRRQAAIAAYLFCQWANSGCTAPGIPVATAASAVTASSFSANWNAASGATSYILDVSTASNFSSFVPGFDALDVGNVTTFSVTGLSDGVIYFYRVRADNSCQASTFSNTITAQTNIDLVPNFQGTSGDMFTWGTSWSNGQSPLQIEIYYNDDPGVGTDGLLGTFNSTLGSTNVTMPFLASSMNFRARFISGSKQGPYCPYMFVDGQTGPWSGFLDYFDFTDLSGSGETFGVNGSVLTSQDPTESFFGNPTGINPPTRGFDTNGPQAALEDTSSPDNYNFNVSLRSISACINQQRFAPQGIAGEFFFGMKGQWRVYSGSVPNSTFKLEIIDGLGGTHVIDSGINAVDDTWRNITITYDGAQTFKLYVDGTLTGTLVTANVPLATPSQEFEFGGSATFGMSQSNMDELIIWGATLTPASVAYVATNVASSYIFT